MSSSSSPCAACKFLQRNCTQGCVFAPYFPADQQRFSNVFHVYGTSSVAKMLNRVSHEHRKDVANSLAYQADMRVIYPVEGCLGDFLELKEEIRQRREIIELLKLQKEIEEEIRQKREILEPQEKLQEQIKEEIRQKREILELQEKLQEEIKEEIRQKSEILELQEGIRQKRQECWLPPLMPLPPVPPPSPMMTPSSEDPAPTQMNQLLQHPTQMNQLLQHYLLLWTTILLGSEVYLNRSRRYGI